MIVTAATTAGAKDAAKEMVVDGEHFTARQITDPKMNNIVAYRFYAPKQWKDSGQVYWNLFHGTHPTRVTLTVQNPANSEAFFIHEAMMCGYIPPRRAGGPREGQDTGDGLWLRPMKPQDALAMYIKKARGQYADLKFIGSRDLPELPKIYHLTGMGTTQHGIAEKITYTLNGKPVEEEFYAVHYYGVVQGEALWGLIWIHSFRAPAGTVDKRRTVFAAIAKSVTMAPDFGRRLVAVQNQLWARHQAKIKREIDGANAAAARSKAAAAADDQWLANIDRGLTAARAPAGGSSGSGDRAGGAAARSANDRADDVLRGVETVDDPATGTSQHSFLEEKHWTDGYQNYINSNDPNYDPNRTEVGTWTLMTPAQ